MRTATLPSKKKLEIPPRQRLLEAARQLFYSRGIRSVSVDEIAEGAQTNKMTLYRHFESKDLLVAEYLKLAEADAEARYREIERAHPGDPFGVICAWIKWVSEGLGSADGRGCPMANAAVEIPEKDHPARAVIEQSKTRSRERLVGLCRDAGFLEPERLADELFLLFEGACINIQSVGNCGPGCRFAQMAHNLMKSHARTSGWE